jgi:hypothetical protein
MVMVLAIHFLLNVTPRSLANSYHSSEEILLNIYQSTWHNTSGNPNLQKPYLIKDEMVFHIFSVTNHVQIFHT